MKQLIQYALVFQALGDVTRQRILLLLEERDRCVNELVSQFKLSQPTISKHLSVLRQANLVTDTRDGRRVCYSLNREHLLDCYERYFGQFTCCCQAKAEDSGPIDNSTHSVREEVTRI